MNETIERIKEIIEAEANALHAIPIDSNFRTCN